MPACQPTAVPVCRPLMLSLWKWMPPSSRLNPAQRNTPHYSCTYMTHGDFFCRMQNTGQSNQACTSSHETH